MSDAEPPVDRWHHPRAATAMRVIAVIGVVVGVIVPIGLWQFLTDVDRNVDRSLVIGEDAAASLSETIDVAEDVIAALDAGLATLGETLGTIDAGVGDTAGLASSTAELAARLPDGFARVDDALATVESLSRAVDGALRAASAVPFGPDYDPAVPLPTAIADLREAFGPISDDLDRIATELESFGDTSGELRERVDGVGADLGRTRAALEASGRLLDSYRETAADAERLAATSRDDLDRSIRWARAAALLIGVVIILGQFVPWWLGGRLRA